MKLSLTYDPIHPDESKKNCLNDIAERQAKAGKYIQSYYIQSSKDCIDPDLKLNLLRNALRCLNGREIIDSKKNSDGKDLSEEEVKNIETKCSEKLSLYKDLTKDLLSCQYIIKNNLLIVENNTIEQSSIPYLLEKLRTAILKKKITENHFFDLVKLLLPKINFTEFEIKYISIFDGLTNQLSDSRKRYILIKIISKLNTIGVLKDFLNEQKEKIFTQLFNAIKSAEILKNNDNLTEEQKEKIFWGIIPTELTNSTNELIISEDYKIYKIFTNQVLGGGSFGKVCIAEEILSKKKICCKILENGGINQDKELNDKGITLQIKQVSDEISFPTLSLKHASSNINGTIPHCVDSTLTTNSGIVFYEFIEGSIDADKYFLNLANQKSVSEEKYINELSTYIQLLINNLESFCSQNLTLTDIKPSNTIILRDPQDQRMNVINIDLGRPLPFPALTKISVSNLKSYKNYILITEKYASQDLIDFVLNKNNQQLEGDTINFLYHYFTALVQSILTLMNHKFSSTLNLFFCFKNDMQNILMENKNINSFNEISKIINNKLDQFRKDHTDNSFTKLEVNNINQIDEEEKTEIVPQGKVKQKLSFLLYTNNQEQNPNQDQDQGQINN